MITLQQIPLPIDINVFISFVSTNFGFMEITDGTIFSMYLISNFFYIIFWVMLIFSFLKYFITLIFRGFR